MQKVFFLIKCFGLIYGLLRTFRESTRWLFWNEPYKANSPVKAVKSLFFMGYYELYELFSEK